MIYKAYDKYSLREEFIAYDRDYYSYDGYQALIDIFDECGQDWELDVIAICCDFTEGDEEEIRANYSIPEDESVEDYLNDNTIAYKVTDGFLYQTF